MQIEEAMAHANALSLRALGQTSPNPIVGAVLLDSSSNVIGEGFHRRGTDDVPGPHAEIIAIQSAGENARGATLVVTLEPCNHHGKTPPCSEAIIKAGITRVIFAMSDPHAIAHGGARRLKDAGIEVMTGVGADVVAWSNRAWLTKIEKNRPYITVKIASTLDGYIAAEDGTSKWITSEDSRHDVALLRSHVDAIVTGTGTVIADDPSLTARIPGVSHQPTRIVLGERAIPRDAKILDSAALTQIISSRSIDEFLEFCRAKSFNHVLLEAGPTLTSAFLRAGFVDEVIMYQAPTFLGSGRNAIGSMGIHTLSNRFDFELHTITRIGEGKSANTRIHLLARGGR